MAGYLLRRVAGTIPVLLLISLLVFLLIHAAPGVTAILITQIELVVFGHKTQSQHAHLQILVLHQAAPLAAFGHKVAHVDPQWHASAATIAIGPIGEHATAPKAHGDQLRYIQLMNAGYDGPLKHGVPPGVAVAKADPSAVPLRYVVDQPMTGYYRVMLRVGEQSLTRGYTTEGGVAPSAGWALNLSGASEQLVERATRPDLPGDAEQVQAEVAAVNAGLVGPAVVAVVDTNHSPEGVDYVIPGNDDASRAVKLYARAVADAILDGRANAVADVVSAIRGEDEFVEVEDAA